MSVVRIEIGRAYTAWLYGDGSVIHPAIKAARSPKQWDSQRRAVKVPKKFIDDVMAALELQSGVDLEVERVTG